MDIIVLILVLLIPLFATYKLYEPRIDVVVHPKEKLVLLWYNLFDEGYPTGKRGYKKLFTLKI